mmetsp:Transcript_4655/g.10055  ORF Transcript_4655/g.10055 Transcript_4655/m.10055 type:complete len:240 (+) Transcript_4655:420-1139(+)
MNGPAMASIRSATSPKRCSTSGIQNGQARLSLLPRMPLPSRSCRRSARLASQCAALATRSFATFPELACVPTRQGTKPQASTSNRLRGLASPLFRSTPTAKTPSPSVSLCLCPATASDASPSTRQHLTTLTRLSALWDSCEPFAASSTARARQHAPVASRVLLPQPQALQGHPVPPSPLLLPPSAPQPPPSLEPSLIPPSSRAGQRASRRPHQRRSSSQIIFVDHLRQMSPHLCRLPQP